MTRTEGYSLLDQEIKMF